jgi:aldose 1-epimerase
MIKQSTFGHMPDGTAVEQFCLSNAQNVKIEILNLGGIIRRWLIPRPNQPHADIVLGFDTVEDYLADDSYLGALVGRYANRINKGQFQLKGNHYQTDINLGEHCLHGGGDGFSHKVWKSTMIASGANPSLMLELISPDGDQGFPGNLSVKVIYTLSEQNVLKIEYFARSDRTTIFNPTNHSYFNLSGHNSGSVNNHHIQLLASHYTPTDQSAIPTGEVIEVDNTAFDFSELTQISHALGSDHQQISYGNGLDHNLCLDQYTPNNRKAKYCGQAVSHDGVIQLKIYTNMPGLQIFTANHFANKAGKDGTCYQAYQGVCFETQFYPDSPNQPNFPSATLEVGDEFYSTTEFKVVF